MLYNKHWKGQLFRQYFLYPCAISCIFFVDIHSIILSCLRSCSSAGPSRLQGLPPSFFCSWVLSGQLSSSCFPTPFNHTHPCVFIAVTCCCASFSRRWHLWSTPRCHLVNLLYIWHASYLCRLARIGFVCRRFMSGGAMPPCGRVGCIMSVRLCAFLILYLVYVFVYKTFCRSWAPPLVDALCIFVPYRRVVLRAGASLQMFS